MTYYIVTEFQLNNGTPSVVSYAFSDRNSAVSRYYTILATACQTTLDMHGAYLTSSEGAQMMSEIFDRRPEEEPESEPEPEE